MSPASRDPAEPRVAVHRVRNHLRLEIEAYDETIRRFIPGYEEMLARASAAVAAVSPDRVLDLGAGTGGLSRALLDRPEIGSVELFDVDPEMLEQARARLKGFAERVQLTLSSFDDPLPSCDAAAASLALHHIPTLEAKEEMYRRIFAALRPGGVLVNADAMLPQDPGLRRAAFREWAAHLVSEGIEDERAWLHFEEWAEEDTYFSLDQELAALETVGFKARCAWSEGPIKVVVASKPGRGAVSEDRETGD